jgi:hypothetical protein
MQYRLLVMGLLIGQLLWRCLLFPVGLLVWSAVGLLMVQQYGLALLVLTLALLVYEGGYWLLVGRWGR